MKTNILKKSLWVACAAFLLASCTDLNLDNPEGAPEPNVGYTTILQDNWFMLMGSYYHNGTMPVPTAATPADIKATLSKAIVVEGTAYANVTIVSKTRFLRFCVGVDGINEFYEAFPITRAVEVTSAATIEKYDEATGEYTYVLPIEYAATDNTDFTIRLAGEDYNCNIYDLLSVKPSDPVDPITPPAPTPPDVEPTPSGPSDPDPDVHGKAEDLHVYITFDQQKDVDLYLITPGGEQIFWDNLSGDVRAYPGGPFYHWWMDIDAYHECNKTDPKMEHLFIPKEIVCNGTYYVLVNLHKHCSEAAKTTNWSLWVTFDDKAVKDNLTGTTFTQAAPLKGTFEANCPFYSVGYINNAKTDKRVVMTFTINNPLYKGSGWARGKNGKTAAQMQQDLLDGWANCEYAPKTDAQIVKEMECE